MLKNRKNLLLDIVGDIQVASSMADLRDVLSREHPADIADALHDLEEGERELVFDLLEEEKAGAVLDAMEEGTDREELLEHLEPDALTDIVETMPADEAVDLLGDLSKEQREDVLERLDDEDARDIRDLLQYREDTAGGIMTTDLVALRTDMTAARAIDALREWGNSESIFYVYVVDARKQLVGIVALQNLVTSKPDTPMQALMDPDVITVDAETDQEEVARIFTHYGLLAMPVVDNNGLLLGRITLDDVMEVIEEENTEDVYKMVGTDEEEARTRSVLRVIGIRLPWLLICLLGTLVSATVIKAFEGTLGKAIALAAFFFLGTGAVHMVRESLEPVIQGAENDLNRLEEMNHEVDRLHGAIITYLSKLSLGILTESQTRQLYGYMAAGNYLKNISDIIETNLIDTGASRLRNNLEISDSTKVVLGDLHDRVGWSVERAVDALVSFDKEVAAEVTEAKSEINLLADSAEQHLSRRLVADEPMRLHTFRLESGLIEYYKRVYYFAKRIAKVVAEEEIAYLPNDHDSEDMTA